MSGFTYDLLGRRTQAGFGAASTTSPVYDSAITYTYDAGNRVTQIADSANGTITRAYDDRFDAVTQETTPQGSVTYTYDAAGRRATMTPSGGTQAAYTYDDAGRLTQIAQGTSTVGFAYDDANRRSTLTLANGVVVTYGYDNGSQVTSLAYRDGSNNLLGDLTYAYDNAGRRTAMGGSFARANLPAAMASAVYDVNNRVTSWDGASLSHDANGNLLGFQGDTYAWNSRDELSGITGTNSASFAYDGVGRRQGKTVGGTATQFLYDGVNPIQELSGATVTANVLTGLGVDEYLMRTEGSNVQHYLTDALGSTARLTDGSAVKLVDYTYEPYGKASADAGSTNALQFTGRENDGTGLYYYRARYQSPVLGRFISEDPIGLAGGDNTYAYVDGNPISNTDPLGLLFTGLHMLSRDREVAENATLISSVGTGPAGVAAVTIGVPAASALAPGTLVGSVIAVEATGSTIIRMATKPSRAAIIGRAISMVKELPPNSALPPVDPPIPPAIVRPAPQMRPPPPTTGGATTRIVSGVVSAGNLGVNCP